MSDWQTRKRAGYPIREDWEAGRCLGPDDLASLSDGDRVSVVWGGGNGPHVYTAKSEGEHVLACADGVEPGYPGDLYSPAFAGARGLTLWAERAE